mmetsp:Transcript_12713/g.24074  ORF Transcript_12713/g.24074 Transcript_12713/m.24074 type:complete len:503 (+) Transcript_12713:982-2490(+)
MEKSGISPDKISFGSLMAAYGQAGKWQAALSLWRAIRGQLPRRQCEFCLVHALAAMKKASENSDMALRNQLAKTALFVFNDAKEARVPLSSAIYNSIISATSAAGYWKVAVSLLSRAEQEKFDQLDRAYVSLIASLGDRLLWEKALDIFRMRNQTSNPKVWNAMIACLGKGFEWGRALDLFEEYQRRNMTVSIVTLASVLTSIVQRNGGWPKALEMLDSHRRNSVSDHTVSEEGSFDTAVQCLLQSISRQGLWSESIRILKRFQPYLEDLTSVTPTVITTLAKSHRWMHGLGVITQLSKSSVALDTTHYNLAILCYGGLRQWENAYSLTLHSNRQSLDADVYTYAIGANAMLWNGKWQLALEIARDLCPFEGNSAIASAHLKALVASGKSADALEYFKNQFEPRHKGTASLLASLLLLLVGTPEHREHALDIIATMEARGIRFSPKAAWAKDQILGRHSSEHVPLSIANNNSTASLSASSSSSHLFEKDDGSFEATCASDDP